MAPHVINAHCVPFVLFMLCDFLAHNSDVDGGTEVAKVASSESIDSEGAVRPDKEQAADSAENDADADDDSIADDNKPAKQNSLSADESASTNLDASTIAKGEDFVNTMGVRFTPHSDNGALLLFINIKICQSSN